MTGTVDNSFGRMDVVMGCLHARLNLDEGIFTLTVARGTTARRIEVATGVVHHIDAQDRLLAIEVHQSAGTGKATMSFGLPFLNTADLN